MALMTKAKNMCENPKAFGRVAWHKKMNVDVTAFFGKNLTHSDGLIILWER